MILDEFLLVPTSETEQQDLLEAETDIPTVQKGGCTNGCLWAPKEMPGLIGTAYEFRADGEYYIL